MTGFLVATLVLVLRSTLGARLEDMDGEGEGGAELVVTTWNILSFSKSRNPFEFSGIDKKEVRALESASYLLLDLEQRSVDVCMGEENKQRVKDAISNCGGFEMEAIKEKCESSEGSEEWLETRLGLKASDFMLEVGQPDHKLSTLDYSWQKRTGFNELFNCNPLSKNGKLDPAKFEFSHVIDLLLFDMLLKATYDKILAKHPELDETRRSICDSMFSPEGPQKRMASVVKTLAAFSSDVGFLNEIPKIWLEGSGAGPSLLTLEARKHGYYVLAAKTSELDKDDNTVILIKLSSFDSVIPPTLHKFVDDHEIKGLAVELTPEGMTKPVTLLGMHLSSKVNEDREAGLEFAASFTGAVIAAADTNGEPRSKAYGPVNRKGQKENFFFESPVGGGSLHRATEAPYSEDTPNEDLDSDRLAELPAYGTCNKVRTALQAQLRKAHMMDRLMKDNIYYKSGPDVTVGHVDLCDDCSAYTFGDKMSCFGVKATPEEAPMSPNPDAPFAITCGYLHKTKLPDTSQDWGISDHSPVTARFKLSEV